jgi:hypothetical protein
MADIVITSTNVIPVSTDATNAFEYGISNAAIPAGSSVYWEPTTGLYGLFDADSATASVHTLRGVAVSSAAASGSAVVVQTAGSVSYGAVLTKAVTYGGGAGTAGAISPAVDQSTGDYIHILGIATTTSVLNLKILNTGVAF